MVDPVATPSDVKVEYATSLGDSRINAYLDRAVREIDRVTDISSLEQNDRQDLEAAYAAYLIATRSEDRAESSIQSGSTSADYEVSTVEELRKTINKLDPSGELIEDDPKPDLPFEVF